ncbi:MAG: heme peroxidase family protein [Methylococcaceae bacterium]|jgi:hypothetical protein
MTNKHHGMLPFKGIEHLCTMEPFRPGRFARLFAELPPLYIDPLLLHEIGKAGGSMEDKGVANLTKNVPVGLIFFGQLIDHDITLDDSSSLTATNDPLSTENVRTPTLDLDCVYGDGPGGHPFFYDNGVKLLTGADYADPNNPNDLKNFDLPRTPKNTAIIGDPRNDENRIVSQLQLGFLRFHNKVVDIVAAKPNAPTGADLFAEARRIVTWHYQWVLINDYLRTICGDWIIDDILANGRKIYRPEHMGINEAFIPIEFATAAYRYGHTMIPQKFSVQPGGPQHDVFGTTLGKGFSPIISLDEVVDWAALLDSGNGQFERAGEVDTKLAKALLDLPFIAPTAQAFERSLAVRNLLRAQSFLVPSGEQVASAMMAAGAVEISTDMIASVREAGEKLGLPKATPLWLYILAEGRVVGRQDENQNGKKKFTKGEGLGPVGARFVAEVLIGLLELDPRSFLGTNRNWSPADTATKIGANGVTTLYQLLTV